MSENPYLMSEESVPANWTPAPETEPKNAPAPPVPNDMPQYFSGSLAPNLQHDTSFVGTEVGTPRIPKYALMPFGLQGNPATNAAVQSTSTKTVVVAPSGGGGLTSVELDIPNIFTPITQTSTGPAVVLSFSLATEPPGYVFQAPPVGLSSWQGTTQNSFLSVVGGGTLSVAQTPTSSTSLGLIWQNGGSNFSFPATWTQVGATLFGYKSITGVSPVSVSYTVPSQIDGTAFISLFNGPAPTLAQSTTGNTNTGTLTLTNASGNTLIIAIRSSDLLPAGPISIVISDSLGNSYSQIVNQSFLGAGSGGIHVQYQTSVWVAPNCLGGSNTLTWAINGPGSLGTPSIVFMEFGPLAAGATIPFFAPLSSGSIPPINLASTGNGGVGGTLGVPNGGTGVTTSTGTGSTVRSISPTLTGTLAAGSETLTGKITNYNSLATVSNGVPSELATIDLTNQSANIGATTLLASPAQQMYRVSAYVVETTPDGASSTLPTVQVVYTDFDSNTSVTVSVTPSGTVLGLGQNGASGVNTNATGTLSSGVVVINPKAAVAIQYQTVNYASGTPAAMKYALHIKLEAL